MNVALFLRALLLITPVIWTIGWGINEYRLYEFLLSYSDKKALASFTQYVPYHILKNEEIRDAEIIIVGSSDAREFFPHNDKLLALFSKHCNRDVKVFNAASSSQSLSDTLAVIAALKYMGFNPRKIVVGLSEGRLLLDNSNAEVSLSRQRVFLPAHPELVSDQNVINRLAYFMAIPFQAMELWLYGNNIENLKSLQETEMGYLNRNYYKPPPLPVEIKLDRIINDAHVYHSSFLRNAVISTSKYADYFKHLSNDFMSDFVFIYTPRSPLVWEQLAKIEAGRESALENIHRAGFPLKDLQFFKGLKDENFYDSSHLLPEGRDIFWKSDEGKELLTDLCKR